MAVSYSWDGESGLTAGAVGATLLIEFMSSSNYGMLCIVAVYDELDLDVFRIARSV